MLAYQGLIIIVTLQSTLCEQQKQFNISEQAPIGHFIGYLNDTPSDGIKANFYIVFPDNTGEAEKYLKVEEVSGEISVLRELDYERHTVYHLIAIPVNSHSQSEAIHVTVNIIDENDNTPKFPVSSFNISISEFAALNSEISLPPAVDNDSVALSVIKYHILSGNVNNAFRLSSKRINSMLYVDLIVNGQLDREYRDQYELLIEALDGGNPPNSDKLLVKVTILDANDNAPEFSQSTYSATIPWNASTNYIVATVDAVDPDLGENARVAYSIAKNHVDFNLPFEIDDKNGVVRVSDAKLLIPGSVYQLLIVANDHGLPQPLESTTFLTVTVQPNTEPRPFLDFIWLTDNNKPEIYENVTIGYVIARITVQNAPKQSELLINGCDSLCVKETESFDVYLLLVCGSFDYEQKFEYNLFFTLKSNQKELLTIPIFFEIIDINDNTPKFKNSTIYIIFNSSTIHNKPIRIQATDLDSGKNGQIFYNLTGTNLFEIESDTGILKIHENFDCSIEEEHFYVHATDFGIPSRSATVDVFAQIIDSTGRPPIFTKPLYNVTVREDTETNTCLLKVTASNSCGNESSIRYSLSKINSAKDPFRIDKNSGKIYLDSILDYELCTIYQLQVYALDINGRSSRALVNIHVEDVNDNLPIFNPEQYNVSVYENVKIGSQLLLLSANDADSGIYGQIHYRFASKKSETFRLDAKSGYLYVQEKLSKGDYYLRIEAVDETGLISEKQAIIHISVINSSTQTPKFTKTLYEFNVLEEILPGITIGKVKATGKFPISYSIYSGDPDHFFAIDARNGHISVAQYLDADKWEQLLLNIQARMENDKVNYTQVLIKLIDNNDNAPEFEMDKIESYIYENHPIHEPFFAVQAYDKDRGKNGEVIYTVLQGEPLCPFTVRPLTGELTLLANLDFETIKKYSLVIQARDQGMPSRSSNITVILNVLDVNDNRPEFMEQMYSVEIPEDIQLMTDILTIQAKDLDSEQNARISYRLSEENQNFDIHPIAGNIFVKANLDRETIAEYRLFVIASDHGKPELLSQATVYIKILDINDNSPSCPIKNSFKLTNDIDIGMTFGKLIATDPDQDLNGSLVYRLQIENANFAIRDNGELFVKKKLSTKENKKENRLSVIVLDRNGDTQARSTICTIRIIVEKIHSKVQFLEPIDHIIKIDEKCLSGCLLKILDATNVVRWKIEMSDISNNFEIRNNTLRTSAYFNATTITDSETVVVTAFDNDGHQKQITFAIRKTDSEVTHVDDKITVIRISKTTPVGSKLLTLNNDHRNRSFWYLTNETETFYLDSITSILYLATNIRWTSSKSYLLKVIKWTLADNYQMEQQNIRIIIEPANIYWPQFFDCPKFFTIKENEPTGSIIGKILAYDMDEDNDEQLRYSIVHDSSFGSFSIDPDTAELLLIRSLHSQKNLSHFLVIEVKDDNWNVVKHSHCAVFINVEDINDHQPKFLSAENITIEDDNFVDGDIINYVVAIDDDTGENAKITYAIIDGNTDNAFSINSNTGALILKYRFNDDKRTIRIRATDNGIPSKYTEKNFTIMFNSGQQKWQFFRQRKYYISINSSITPASVLFDFFENAGNERPTQMKLFSYFITENNILQLLDDGKLIVTDEIIKPGKYDWIVIALKEIRLIDWSFIQLNIIDINRYPPRISSSSCGNLTIRENIATKHLTRIYAWDQDEPNNSGEIFYKIVAGNENSLFYLNSSTGLLSCHALDREKQSQYFLVITAEDQGIPKRADTCTLRITVTDENDNVPIFDDNIPTVIEIDDSKKIGDILGRLSATDPDEGLNGEIIYSIVEDTSDLLDIHIYTGEIIFARDYPTSQNEYSVKVKASDQGFSRVSSTEFNIQLRLTRSKSTLTVKEPQFLNEHYTGFINEGEQRGQFVLQVHSIDHLTEDAPITYSIVSGNMDAAFDIDDNGRIITAQELDYEIENFYKLKVIGTGNNIKKIPETDIHIRVINTNDNVPSFPMLKDRKIPESASYGTLIGTVTATDVDIDTQLEYSLLSSNDHFEIDPYTGKIFLIGTLDYEINKEHNIHIRVTDGENTSRATLRIIIEDINDNAPQFEQQFYVINVASDIRLGSIIAKLRANDPDTGLAGKVRYELASNSVNNFMIDPESGDLSVVDKLEDRLAYYLKVHAYDQGKPIQSSVVAVQINVGIENNDRKPILFTKTTFNFTIPENTHPYTQFGQVTFTGKLPIRTSLRIQNFIPSDVFGISNDGSIFLKYSVDAELINEFEFLVEAFSPYAAYNSTAKVYVKITDLNDNAPYFAEKIDEITINEGMMKNEILGRFVAMDYDSSDNERISYQILSGNDYGLFILNNSSGELYLAKNAEIMEMHLKDNNLLIAAIDNGTPARFNWTTVQIRFNSILFSATAPSFIVSQYETNVFEDLPTGNIVLYSKAVNKLGILGDDWFYTVTDTTNKSFSCNANTGHIILTKKLDFETQTKYEFILKVQDNRNRSATVPVLIRVVGVDEFPPIFSKTNYIFQIPRSSKVGQLIGIVTAVDRDSGIDGVIHYEIQGNAARYLSIDSSTGRIMLSHKPPYYSTAINITSDEFMVIASSSVKQSSRVKVIVQIGDFTPSDMFTTTKILTVTQMLIIGSLFLIFVFFITLIILINKRTKRHKKSKKVVYSVNKGNFAIVKNLSRSLQSFERDTPIAPPLPSSPCARFKNSSTIAASNFNNNTSAKLLFKPSVEAQMAKNHSVTYSMPDSGIDPDDISVTSSITDYLNQVGVKPNKYFDSNQGQSREPFMNHIHNDPEISNLIYAKVDEILSPANRMNVCFTSNGSINIASFNANAINSDSEPTFRPLSELLLNMRKQQHC